MRVQHFTDDYDKDTEVYSCRFWLMCKMKFASIFDQSYDLYIANLKSRLLDMNASLPLVKKELESIQILAYRTINPSFFKKIVDKPVSM
jgi:hypothetical protein